MFFLLYVVFILLLTCFPFFSVGCSIVLFSPPRFISGVQPPRPITPGDNAVVYGIALLRKGVIRSLIGTAFAISDKLAISAWHNFTGNDFDTASDEIILYQEINAGNILASSPRAVVSDFDVNDDWVALHLSSLTFPKYAVLCPETELPASDDDVVGVRDFPVGLLDSLNHLKVGRMSAKLWTYSTPFEPSNPPSKKLCLVDEFPSGLVECMVNVRGGRVLGSCGAPYFAENGKVFAFHVGSINDADHEDMKSSSGHSHASYSEGRVLVRLRSFTAKFSHLFV